MPEICIKKSGRPDRPPDFFIYRVNKFTSKGRIRGRTLEMRISKIQEMEDDKSCSL